MEFSSSGVNFSVSLPQSFHVVLIFVCAKTMSVVLLSGPIQGRKSDSFEILLAMFWSFCTDFSQSVGAIELIFFVVQIFFRNCIMSEVCLRAQVFGPRIGN